MWLSDKSTVEGIEVHAKLTSLGLLNSHFADWLSFAKAFKANHTNEVSITRQSDRNDLAVGEPGYAATWPFVANIFQSLQPSRLENI